MPPLRLTLLSQGPARCGFAWPTAVSRGSDVHGCTGESGHRIPPLVMTLLGPFMPIMRELKEMNYQWEHAYDFRCDKIKDAYGLTPTPHVDAVAQTVAWFRTRTS